MKNIILSEIAQAEKLKAHAFKCAKGNLLWEDCMSELVLYLANMNESKLIELYTNNNLYIYCYKIIWLSFNSVSSPFYIKYIKKDLYIEVDTGKTGKICEAYVNDRLIEIEKTSKKYPVEALIFKLYLEKGSYRAVEKETGIPFRTVCDIVNKLKNVI